MRPGRKHLELSRLPFSLLHSIDSKLLLSQRLRGQSDCCASSFHDYGGTRPIAEMAPEQRNGEIPPTCSPDRDS